MNHLLERFLQKTNPIHCNFCFSQFPEVLPFHTLVSVPGLSPLFTPSVVGFFISLDIISAKDRVHSGVALNLPLLPQRGAPCP